MTPDGDYDYEFRRDVDARLGKLERNVAVLVERAERGISGGAEREITALRDTINQLRIDAQQSMSELRLEQRSLEGGQRSLETQINRWQGGSSVLYMIATGIGGILGWLLNHLGIGK